MRARIGAAALAHKLPAVTYIAEEVPSGYLMSYGQDLPDYVHRAVAYVDKMLKGANPADLPVEQPTRFKLVLNLKTAKALGLTDSADAYRQRRRGDRSVTVELRRFQQPFGWSQSNFLRGFDETTRLRLPYLCGNDSAASGPRSGDKQSFSRRLFNVWDKGL